MQNMRNGENRHMSASFNCERAKSSVTIKVSQLKFEGHLMNRNQVLQAVLTDITSIVLRTFWHNSDMPAAVLVDRCFA